MYQIDIDQQKNILLTTSSGMLTLDEVQQARQQLEQAHQQQKLKAGFSYIVDISERKTVAPEVWQFMETMNAEVHIKNPPGLVVYVSDAADGSGPQFSGAGLVKNQTERASEKARANAQGLVTYKWVKNLALAYAEHDRYVVDGLAKFQHNWNKANQS